RNLSKGRKGNENSIYDREIIFGRSPGSGDGARRLGGVSGRHGPEIGERVTRRVSARRNRGGERRVLELGGRDRRARGRECATAGTSVGFTGDRFSAASVAGAPRDSTRSDADVQPNRASRWQASRHQGSCEGMRYESRFDCCAMSQSGTRGWKSCRVPVGIIAKREIARARAELTAGGKKRAQHCSARANF